VSQGVEDSGELIGGILGGARGVVEPSHQAVAAGFEHGLYESVLRADMT
jgi:hypothetical protein